MENPYIKDRKVIFEGRTKQCHCDNGRELHYTDTCTDCKGDKKFRINGRKCKRCKGDGYIRLDNPKDVGPCKICNGIKSIPLGAYDAMLEEDKEWIFNNLFNFEKPYTAPTSSFNEEYLGIGIVCGVTDYGHYKKMNPDEFKKEVKDNFMNRYSQYVGLLKDELLPKEILITKKESGWFAYPVY